GQILLGFPDRRMGETGNQYRLQQEPYRKPSLSPSVLWSPMPHMLPYKKQLSTKKRFYTELVSAGFIIFVDELKPSACDLRHTCSMLKESFSTASDPTVAAGRG